MAEGSDIKLKLEAENPEKLVDALFDDDYFEESKITERERQNREYKKSLLRSSMRGQRVERIMPKKKVL